MRIPVRVGALPIRGVVPALRVGFRQHLSEIERYLELFFHVRVLGCVGRDFVPQRVDLCADGREESADGRPVSALAAMDVDTARK